MRGLFYIFLLVLPQVHSSDVKVIGFIGHNVTLPCRYDTLTHGVLGFCWGRGDASWFNCPNTILHSRDGALPSLRDPRYQLLGRVMDGEVSLTVLNAQWSDAGAYTCRVAIPGLFNDYIVNTYLTMEEEVTTSEAPTPYSISIVTDEKTFKALGMGDIVRMATIFFLLIIIIGILVFKFWRKLPQKRTLEHLNTSAVESIYVDTFIKALNNVTAESIYESV